MSAMWPGEFEGRVDASIATSRRNEPEDIRKLNPGGRTVALRSQTVSYYSFTMLPAQSGHRSAARIFRTVGRTHHQGVPRAVKKQRKPLSDYQRFFNAKCRYQVVKSRNRLFSDG